MSEAIELRTIGYVRGGRAEPIDDGWDAVTAEIVLTPDFGAEALAGLDGFSHVEVVFLFNRVAESAVVAGARHPRGRTDWPKVGIFAQRGKDRPNRLGVTICRLLASTSEAPPAFGRPPDAADPVTIGSYQPQERFRRDRKSGRIFLSSTFLHL